MAKTNVRPSFEDACRMYPHRYTMEHIPHWAKAPCTNERTGEVIFYYAPQYRSDREWYENTLFPGEPGHLIGKRHCQSEKATWPLGQKLSELYIQKKG
jgi:hypothetical protein